MQERILCTITSAISHLQNSVKQLSSRSEKEAFSLIWQASSDVECCLFLFSLLHPNQAETFSLKRKPVSKQTEIQEALTSAVNILEDAKRNVESSDSTEAYKKAWKARSHLFNVQKLFEKKRKIRAVRSSTPLS
jgi:hypothetical protein